MMEVGKGSQKGTFAGKRGNGEVAPKAALCHCEQLTVVSRRCRIPHRDVVTLSDAVFSGPRNMARGYEKCRWGLGTIDGRARASWQRQSPLCPAPADSRSLSCLH